MGAQAAASSAFTKAIANKMGAPSQAPSFEDVLNATAVKKAKVAKKKQPKKNSSAFTKKDPYGDALKQYQLEQLQKADTVSKEIEGPSFASKYEDPAKQAALKKLKAALQSSPEAAQQTPINKLKAALQSSPEAAQQTPINKLKAGLQVSPKSTQQTSINILKALLQG